MCRGSSSASSRPRDARSRARRRAALAAALAVVVLAATGCGYHLESAGATRFSDPSLRMDLGPFRNDSADPDAGAYIAARLREELRRSGFRGSFGRIGADYLVEGKVGEMPVDVFSHSGSGFALENRLTVVVEIRVISVRRGEVLWKASGLQETASFYAGPDAQYTEANRRAAFEEVAKRLVLRMAQTIRVVL